VNLTVAAETARVLLSSLPRRVSHVASVADRSASVCRVLDFDPDLLVSAAWLHDVGYAPIVSATGLHALDGARFLRREGFDERVVNLVAHHSHAEIEARERSLDIDLASEFPRDDALPHDALCFCDMTTGPDGQAMPVRERLQEIRARYGPGDVVTRFIDKAEPTIVATVERVERQLAAAEAQSR
jgi:putative nucleotidyltransferase with HDIG domain